MQERYEQLKTSTKDNEEELKNVRITTQKNTAVAQQNI